MTNDEIKVDTIVREARAGRKIELIKMYRQESGKGLKDSKDDVESCQLPSGGYNEYKLINLFYEASGRSSRFRTHEYEFQFYDKEQFLIDIGKAIDAGRILKCNDMLDAVIALCDNIKSQGGLYELAKTREEFVNRI